MPNAVPTIKALALLAFAGALAPAAGRGQETAMFRVDAAHRGVYAGAAPTLESVKWRFRTKGKIIGSPTVARGVVYVGSGDGGVYAVRASDGVRVWRFATKGPVYSTPAVADGTVFISSIDGMVYALDATNGRPRWRFRTAGERRFSAPGIHGLIPRTEVMPDPFDVFLSSPAVAGGTVYVGSGDHNVYALNASSGALRWRFRTGNVVHASPAVSGGVVYIGSWDRNLYALDAQSGAVRWKFQTGDDRTIFNQVGISSSAAVTDGSVYFGSRDSFLYALDAATGHLRWKHDDHGFWVVGSPAILDGSVYFTTSDEKTFFAVDAATGRERFHTTYGTFSFSSPSIAGHVAYFGTFDGRLYGVDITSGRIVARFMSDPARRDLAKYLNKKDQLDLALFYLDPTLGGAYVAVDRIEALGSFPGSPAIAGGVLFIGGTDGTLYAIR